MVAYRAALFRAAGPKIQLDKTIQFKAMVLDEYSNNTVMVIVNHASTTIWFTCKIHIID